MLQDTYRKTCSHFLICLQWTKLLNFKKKGQMLWLEKQQKRKKKENEPCKKDYEQQKYDNKDMETSIEMSLQANLRLPSKLQSLLWEMVGAQSPSLKALLQTPCCS